MASPAAVLTSRIHRVRTYLADLWTRREFAWFLAMGNLKARNASTALGLFWWVLNPLLLGAVYFLVFGFIFPGGRDLGYLMTGMFAFHFTAQAMTGGANSILQNAKLLVNLRFPRLILPIANLIESGVGFLASLVVLFVMVLPTGGLKLTAGLALLPLILLIHLTFNLGLSAITARMAVPFRDINNVLPYISRLWLYLTPIIWPLETMDRFPDDLVPLVEANPLFSIVGLYRTAFLGYEFQSTYLVSAAAWAVAVAGLGLALFVRYEGRMVRYL